MGIVYISHRLDELLAIADTVSVLRDGRLVAESDAAVIDTRWIVERMTGRPAGAVNPSAAPVPGPPLLRVDNLSLAAPGGRPLLRGVSFGLHAGEIVGIYGLMGAGRTEMLECLMGLHREAAGSIFLDSRRLDSLDTAARISAGLAMAPEDRQTSSLVPTLSVLANMTLSAIDRFARGGWLSTSAEESAGAGPACRVAAEHRVAERRQSAESSPRALPAHAPARPATR
ncbi:ABC transporter (fragment) [Candidatus Sulfopaludibacter sp. SbA3]